MKTGILAQQSGKENPTNLLPNGDFENWTAGTAVAPDGWTILSSGSSAVAREASIIKMGIYSAKIVLSGGTYIFLTQEIHATKGIAYWKGRTLTLGCWVYATVANITRIQIGDGVDNSYSSYHPGDSQWHFLTVNHTVNSSATTVQIVGRLGDNGDGTAYFDGAMCVEGSSAFAFADKPAGEDVWTDYFATSTIVGWAAGKTGNIMVKKIGKTVFVSYFINGTSDNATTTFTVPYTAEATISHQVPCGYSIDNGSTSVNPAYIYITGGSTTITAKKSMADADFTSSGAKRIAGQFFYESA